MRLAALRRLVHDESGKRDALMIKRRGTLPCTREPILDPHAFSPPSPLNLLTSVFLMDQTYIKGTTRLRTKMASPSLLSQISCRGASDPISKPQL
jgi:hypothetical protein